MAPFRFVDAADFEIYAASIVGEDPPKVETKLRYSVAGKTATETREQRVGTWVMTWELARGGADL